jgi:hypothetical protein
MTPDRDLARRLTNHFAEEAPGIAPEWVLPSALSTIESTRQRRGLFAPWRFNPMPMYAKLGAAAAAVVAVLAVAVWQLNPPGPGHPTSTPTPSAAPSPVFATTTPYVAPALTQTFTSSIYGLSVSYPREWSVMPATTPWVNDPGGYREAQGDLLYDPNRDNLFLKLASQQLGDLSFEQWSALVFDGRGCTGARAPVTIDGVQGLVDASCYTALVQGGNRGYLILAHWDYNLVELRSVSWEAWLQDVLATVHLQPEKAVDSN